uniref:cysteine dioxygenase n=1 Tax=Musa acuminata subsp. malaccensis TaxID=214687 RepID=A0A804K2P9_MUSAM|nr:PREDICTED: plant cysteine oxidase 2-like isoform X2 [Musa acuminata subsp. malaccensis]
MGVDGGLADPTLRAELATEKNTYSSKKKKRRQKKPTSTPSAVQRLFETCKEVFAHGGRGFIPSADDVERLRSVLDTLKLTDVGVSPNLPFFHHVVTDGPPPVTYLHLYACSNFSIGIFCLPQAAVIPLHNHPGMTVVSKLLFGSMHIKSYDWVNDPEGSNEKIKSSNVTSCAVLDVLGPPYNDDEGRACSYYKEYVFSSFPGKAIGVSGESKEYAWLEERESKPDDLVVRGAEYRGPKIVGR